MPQTSPKYTGATSVANPAILSPLESKYGSNNVVWPIVLIEGEQIVGYLYERTRQNRTNAPGDRRPVSKAGLPSYFLDYTASPRTVTPYAQHLVPSLGSSYQCSYDFILDNARYSTVDLDYVWRTGQGWKGFELTTFYVEFVAQRKAEDLICKMNRRPSWKGPEGPHALHKVVDAAEDLGIDFHLFCINTVGRVTDKYKTDGNVYWFPLTHDQIDRLVQGKVPHNARFSTFQGFLQWL